jgi:hypothetical protein
MMASDEASAKTKKIGRVDYDAVKRAWLRIDQARRHADSRDGDAALDQQLHLLDGSPEVIVAAISSIDLPSRRTMSC